MVNKSIIGATCACLAVVSFSADAALVGRLAATPGGTDYQAYYDDVADLTWLADANAAVGSVYDTVLPGSGIVNWADANAWAAGLSVGGVTGWRLPETNPVNGMTYNYTFAYDGSTDYGYNISAPGTAYAGSAASELANMFYSVLGNTGYFDASGTPTGCNPCFPSAGPFSNLQSNGYWSATEYAPTTISAWVFGMHVGIQADDAKVHSYYPWAVQSGDVSAVPVPAAVWLFGSGLIGLIGVARRKEQA